MSVNVPSRRVLAVFDFDGTLTYRDSFTLFLRKELGFFRYALGLIRLALPALGFLVGHKTRDELKGYLIRNFLTGFSVAEIAVLSDDFCRRQWPSLMREAGCAEVSEQVQQGALVTICSASPEIILKPFAERLGVQLIATQLEERNGVLTGSIRGRNCRQAEKVKRLTKVYGDLRFFHVRAWGDSAGDKQLLEAADEPYYRRFH
jgi:HAD superfamily hydrolase (TIGR01490 family)